MNRFSWQQFSLLIKHLSLILTPPHPPKHLALSLPKNTLQTHKNMGGNISSLLITKKAIPLTVSLEYGYPCDTIRITLHLKLVSI